MKKLKPCPFCGGEAELIENYMRSYGTDWWVECKECQARTESNSMGSPEAIEAWNSRADGWISVDEELPKEDGVYITVKKSNRNYVGILYFKAKEKQWVSLANKEQEPILWQPLPTPPKGGK